MAIYLSDEDIINNGIASQTPGPGLIPIALGTGKLDDGWISSSFERVANKGAANGYASLDANSKVIQDPASLTNIVFCNQYDHPDDAIAAIGSDNKTLLVTEPEICDTNFTVPSNVTVKFERGGKWIINDGITVTIHGQIDAGLWQIFQYTGTGTVKGSAGVTEVYPEWWGAKGDGVADDTTAIQQAINSGVGKSVVFSQTTYLISDTIHIGQGYGFVDLIGKSMSGVHITSSNNSKDILQIHGLWSGYNVKNLNLSFTSVGTGNGIVFVNNTGYCYGGNFENMEIAYANKGIYSASGQSFMNTFTNIIIYHPATGVDLESGTLWKFENCEIDTPSSQGWYLKSIKYSTLVNCTSVNSTGVIPYYIYTSYGVSLIGCGAEGDVLPNGNGVFTTLGSQVVINGWYVGACSASSGQTGYIVYCDGSGSHTVLTGGYEVGCTNISQYRIGGSGGRLVAYENYFGSATPVTSNVISFGSYKVVTLAANTTTPDVSQGNIFITSANTQATTITDLLNPTVGQIVTFIGGSDTNPTTINDGGYFKLSGTMTLGLDDSITLLVKAPQYYVELSRSTN